MLRGQVKTFDTRRRKLRTLLEDGSATSERTLERLPTRWTPRLRPLASANGYTSSEIKLARRSVRLRTMSDPSATRYNGPASRLSNEWKELDTETTILRDWLS